jgi:hypothetical protein
MSIGSQDYAALSDDSYHDRRSTLHRKFTQCLALLLLTACNPEIAMNQEHAAAEADVANGGRGLAKLNPAPRKAYELTLRLKDAPGPFAVVSGVAQYDVVNEDQCGHVEPATGTASRITSQEGFLPSLKPNPF